MRLSRAVGSVALLVAAMILPAAPATSIPSDPTVTGIVFSGSGCPTKSTSKSWDDAKNTAQLDYSGYKVTSPPSTGRRTCSVTFTLTYPEQTRLIAVMINHSGHQKLVGSGATATLDTQYSWGEETADLPSLDLVDIAAGSSWKADQSALVLVPAGSSSMEFTVTSELSLTARGAASGSTTAMDSESFEFVGASVTTLIE